MSGRTLVIGATGKVGMEVVAGLGARGVEVRAATRHPDRARLLLPAGVDAVEFDYDQPETYAGALDGAGRLFLSVRPGDDHADATAIPVLKEAASRGVRHVVSLTAMGVERLDGNALRRIERHVESSGMSWTHLRPNFFMQIFSAPPLLGQLRGAGVLRVPAGDAVLSFVDVRDIGAVAVAALLEPRHRGCAYTLTGPEAIDHAAAAAIITAALSGGKAAARRFCYEALQEEDARLAMRDGGLGVERLIGFYRLVRAGACAPVSPDVAAVLGRPACSFAQFARDHADVWK